MIFNRPGYPQLSLIDKRKKEKKQELPALVGHTKISLIDHPKEIETREENLVRQKLMNKKRKGMARKETKRN